MEKIVESLKLELVKLDGQAAALRSAIHALNAASSGGSVLLPNKRRKSKFSPETSAKMAAAQRARWAKFRAKQSKK